MLYLKTGLMISEKIKAQKWRAKVLDQISADLQMELPGLKFFSPGNLKKIRIFAEAYTPHLLFGSTVSNEIGETASNEGFPISSTLSTLIDNKVFFGISFSHHFAIITKIKGCEAGYSISSLLQSIFGR